MWNVHFRCMSALCVIQRDCSMYGFRFEAVWLALCLRWNSIDCSVHVDLLDYTSLHWYYFYTSYSSSFCSFLYDNIAKRSQLYHLLDFFFSFIYSDLVSLSLYHCIRATFVDIRFWVNCYYVITIIILRKTIEYYVTAGERRKFRSKNKWRRKRNDTKVKRRKYNKNLYEWKC